MPQDPTERPPRYHTFVLSLWEESGTVPAWRCSLENPHTGERIGFRTLDDMTTYLDEWLQKPSGQTATPSTLDIFQ
jgi:hypothetical protein